MIHRLRREWLLLPAMLWAGICFYLILHILQKTFSTETVMVVSLVGTVYPVTLLFCWISFGRWAAVAAAVLGMVMMGLPLVAIPFIWFLGYFVWFLAVLVMLDWTEKFYENEQLLEQVKTEENLEEKNRLIQELIERRASVQVMREKYNAHVSLKAVADEFASTLLLNDLADLISRKTAEIISRADAVLVYRVDIDTGQPSLMASCGKSDERKARTKLGDQFDHWVLKYRQPLLVTDIASDYRFDVSKEALDPAVQSLMASPMINEGRMIGVLRVSARKAGIFNTDDLRVLSILAVLASSALTNAFLYQKTEELAILDSLTGLYVQRYFRERFEEEHKRALISNHSFSVLMCDIDYFKQCNDKYGHATGDLVLKAVAARLKERVGDSGIVARYGGEEFAIVLRNMDKKQAAELAESIRKDVESLNLAMRSVELKITLSIGLASFPVDALDPEALLNMADQALYRAKQQGRNAVCSAG